jgi:hypothetical protein
MPPQAHPTPAKNHKLRRQPSASDRTKARHDLMVSATNKKEQADAFYLLT